MPVLSLCIPTNGIVEWIQPVLTSIYEQNADEVDFEVVVSDNGGSNRLDECVALFSQYKNFRFYQSNAVLFDNCLECYLHAEGEFVKFINHRTMLNEGSLQYLIDFVKANREDKPVVYFANGTLPQKDKVKVVKEFDEFVYGLGIYNSWGTGIGFWREEIDKFKDKGVNFLFPDMTILYNRRKADKYIIDNSSLLKEIPATHSKKGGYDLYFAFGVEFPALICELYRDGDISVKTFRHISKENLDFLAGLFINFNILNHGYSYDVTNIDSMYGVFYKRSEFVFAVIKKTLQMAICLPFRAIRKVYRTIKKLVGTCDDV